MRDRLWTTAPTTLSLLLILISAAFAQEEADDPSATPSEGIEEIVVTAERRESKVQETPVAISAFSGADLDSAGYQDFEDLGFNIPNFQFGRTLVDSGGITIRGVSSGSGDRSTAFHIDGIYQNQQLAAEGITFFDVERIEVLRGPQGTLYGRNAVGGSINIVSKPPSGEFEAFGDVQFGTYDQIQTRGVVNVPFLGEQLAARVSVFQEHRDGFQENVSSPLVHENADDARNVALRGQLRLSPSDDFDLTLRGTYSHAGGVGPARKVLEPIPTGTIISPLLPIPINLYDNATANPPDVRRIAVDFIGEIDIDQWGVNSSVDWDFYDLPLFGDVKVKALGSFLERDAFSKTDQDLSDDFVAHTIGDTLTQEAVAELQFASAGAGPVDWLLGLFYLNSQATTCTLTQARPLSFLGVFQVIPITVDATQDAQSTAVFGQLSYRPFEDLTLTAGLRYTHDEKQDTNSQPTVFIQTPSGPLVLFFPIDEEDEDKWNSVTGMVRAQWQWSVENMLYLSASRGFKAGEINTQILGLSDTFDNADPEYIWALELGSKNRFFDDRLQANLGIFYYNQRNLQVSQLLGISTFTENAGRANIWGLEAELKALPFPELQLSANASYLDATFGRFNDCIVPEIRNANLDAIPQDCTGNRLTRAPRYTLSLSARYDLDLGWAGTLTPRVQFYASDSIFYRPINFPSDKQDAYTKTDVRLAWRSRDDRISVEGFVENVFDEDVIQTQVTGTGAIGFPLQTLLDEPRTAGIRVGLKF